MNSIYTCSMIISLGFIKILQQNTQINVTRKNGVMLNVLHYNQCHLNLEVSALARNRQHQEHIKTMFQCLITQFLWSSTGGDTRKMVWGWYIKLKMKWKRKVLHIWYDSKGKTGIMFFREQFVNVRKMTSRFLYPKFQSVAYLHQRFM